MKRVALFLATNVAILVVLGIVLQLLGVDSLLDEQGVDLDLRALLIFSALFGMGGSFISLALSKFMAKRSMGVVLASDFTGWERLKCDTIPCVITPTRFCARLWGHQP